MRMAEENPAPPTEWLVTFADMMSLLLTFFILLVSLNELKQEKRSDQYQAMLNSLRHRFGETSATAPAAPREERKPAPPDAARARRQHTLESGPAIRAVDGAQVARTTDTTSEPWATGGTLWFDPNLDQLSPGEETVLRRIVSLVESKPQKLEIRGYTSIDSRVENLSTGDPWNVAYQRARYVADRLIELGVKSRRIRLGIAVANESNQNAVDATGSRPHDRVEVLLLNEFTDEVVETTPAQDAPNSSAVSR